MRALAGIKDFYWESARAKMDDAHNEAADKLAAIARDFAFLRKQVDAAYGGVS